MDLELRKKRVKAKMYNAYCFSPEIIEQKIADSEFFLSIITPVTINSSHHVILDSNGTIWGEYLERLKGSPEAFYFLKIWKTSLDSKNNKILESNIEHSDLCSSNYITNTTILSPTVFKKLIVTSDNNSYFHDLAILQAHGIDLLSEFNLLDSSLKHSRQTEYEPSSFFNNLIKALELVTHTRKNKLEDEHNDFLRDLLTYKGYEVYDQTRRGTSSSGISVGELDLAIKSNDIWVTIIEPLRLNSVDLSNIVTHYNKLINNYNPLRIPYTYMVVYYIGVENSFSTFCSRYKSKLEEIDSSLFTVDYSLDLHNVADINIAYPSIQVFRQSGTLDEENFTCTHICINFVGS